MRVFRGDSAPAVVSTVQDGPRLSRFQHVRRRCFCTTLVFSVAERFAFRRSPPELLRGEFGCAGRVIEYELAGDEGRQWDHARDPSCMQDEGEVAVYDPSRLTVVAVWALDAAGEWVRDVVASPR